MKPYYLLVLLLVLFVSCKSNKDAYNLAYQTLKEKNEENLVAERIITATDISNEVLQGKDTAKIHPAEKITLILGEESNLSNYNIVAASFINRTNARSFHGRMEDDEGYPSVLVQNEEQMYRIIIASSETEEKALQKLDQIKKSLPGAWILIRKL